MPLKQTIFYSKSKYKQEQTKVKAQINIYIVLSLSLAFLPTHLRVASQTSYFKSTLINLFRKWMSSRTGFCSQCTDIVSFLIMFSINLSLIPILHTQMLDWHTTTSTNLKSIDFPVVLFSWLKLPSKIDSVLQPEFLICKTHAMLSFLLYQPIEMWYSMLICWSSTLTSMLSICADLLSFILNAYLICWMYSSALLIIAIGFGLMSSYMILFLWVHIFQRKIITSTKFSFMTSFPT